MWHIIYTPTCIGYTSQWVRRNIQVILSNFYGTQLCDTFTLVWTFNSVKFHVKWFQVFIQQHYLVHRILVGFLAFYLLLLKNKKEKLKRTNGSPKLVHLASYNC
jgi:hypothetical protein